MNLRVEPVTYRFKQPVTAAHGTLTHRELLRVFITDEHGNTGVGEAAPLEPYDGYTLRDCREALDAYRDAIVASAGRGPGDRYTAMRDAADVPPALAAVDIAMWDLAGRREGKPVAQLLAAVPARRVEVNATIAAEDRQGVADGAARAAAQGYRCVKLKVGIGDDAGRVAAARAAAGPEMAIRLDANGAWEVNEAIATIDALSSTGLELVEEPVHGVVAMQAVRERVSVRIAMDETADQPGALVSGAADAVCLKLSRAGGISGLLASATAVRASGAEPYLASTYDGPAGIAAAVHCAAALGALPPCGLATLALFEDGGDDLPVVGGVIEVPTGPGLGVTPSGPGAATI